MFEEQILDAKKHNRKKFCSGVHELDEYLFHYALQHSKKNISVVRVLVNKQYPDTIIGYYTLSAAQIELSELNDVDKKKLPRYPIPCFKLGRLAVDIHFQGQGFGSILMGLIIDRCLEARKNIAAYAIVVDAKNDDAIEFFLHYGFTQCKKNEKQLYLTIR